MRIKGLFHAVTLAMFCYERKQHFARPSRKTFSMKKAINDLLAENVRHFMKLRNIPTQEALAAKVGVVQRTIGYYLDPTKRAASKSGKEPSAKLTEVASLAAALDVEVWQLLMPKDERDRLAAMETAMQAVTHAMAHGAQGNPDSRKRRANDR